METLTAIFFILFRILHFAKSHPMWSRSSNSAVPLLSTWRRSNFAVPLSTWRPWRQCCHHCKIHNILHWKRSTQANGMNVHHLTAWPYVTGSLFAPTRMSRAHCFNVCADKLPFAVLALGTKNFDATHRIAESGAFGIILYDIYK